eukprot:8660119-Pyramimonas_sp.AAC.1
MAVGLDRLGEAVYVSTTVMWPRLVGSRGLREAVLSSTSATPAATSASTGSAPSSPGTTRRSSCSSDPPGSRQCGQRPPNGG